MFDTCEQHSILHQWDLNLVKKSLFISKVVSNVDVYTIISALILYAHCKSISILVCFFDKFSLIISPR